MQAFFGGLRPNFVSSCIHQPYKNWGWSLGIAFGRCPWYPSSHLWTHLWFHCIDDGWLPRSPAYTRRELTVFREAVSTAAGACSAWGQQCLYVGRTKPPGITNGNEIQCSTLLSWRWTIQAWSGQSSVHPHTGFSSLLFQLARSALWLLLPGVTSQIN